MFIGILGSTCSGKRTIIEYLLSKGFHELKIGRNDQKNLDGESPRRAPSPFQTTFESSNALLDYVTRNWRGDYVYLSSDNDLTLAEISVRPFFLVLRVDAPIMHRWRRLQSVRPFDR